MKVTTDACLFGAWSARHIQQLEPSPKKVLDIGTGTGLLALMIAQKLSADIDCIEIDLDAFEEAGDNISASPWANQIEVYHSDANLFNSPYKYDIIVSNPPFYEKELRSPDAKRNIAHHDGLSLQQLLEVITLNLDKNGRFYLLLPYKRNTEIDKLISSNELSIVKKEFVRQSVNHDYFRIMIEGRFKAAAEEQMTDEISIWDGHQQYAEQFIELLKDYYLYL